MKKICNDKNCTYRLCEFNINNLNNNINNCIMFDQINFKKCKKVHFKKHINKKNKKIVEYKYIPIKCIDSNQIYTSIEEASIKTKIKSELLWKCCKGYSHTAGGCFWKFIEVK